MTTFDTKLISFSHLNYEKTPSAIHSYGYKPLVFGESDKALLREVSLHILKGNCVAIPTETVYGLAANALDSNAVHKIFQAKNRPNDNPLIVHVSSRKMLLTLVRNGVISERVDRVIDTFWPGPLTILLEKSCLVPDVVTCGHSTVAVRMPSHPIARAIIEDCGVPLAAPSANTSGKPSPTMAEHVLEDLVGRIPLVVDGGPCLSGIESTVVDLTCDPCIILRPGSITDTMLLPVLPGLLVYHRDLCDQEIESRPTTPGMKYKHYSPVAAFILIKSSVPNDKLSAILTNALNSGKSVGLLRWRDEPLAATYEFNLGSSKKEIASNLFRGLRFMDSLQVDEIYMREIELEDEGYAVMNRVTKAATRIIE